MNLFQGQELPKKRLIVDNEFMCHDLVFSGAGVGLIRDRELQNALDSNKIQLWDHPGFPIKIHFLYQTSRINDPILHSLTEVIEDVWGLSEPSIVAA